ncbi:hypothetical protein CERSUDRAFT_87815 [Gelatoporia subvermispora B]|uniref:DUF6534 domain-containing protein n=1 Tax=Ceriporiopsis subvermispora (strain B) TaxID=914234 RepID=M2QK68_CERS8|nr:hypothetical protein CERSUDRAFT_87815 [Gelatoporia subvermispora B]
MIMSSPAPSVQDTVGAVLVGSLFCAFLSGTVAMQAAFYFMQYSNDRLRNKAMVSIVWAADSAHTAMAAVAVWMYFIDMWGQFDSFDYIPWSIAVTVALTAFVTFIVQCFYANRVYLMSGGKWSLTIPIVASAFVRLVAALVSTSKMIELRSYMAFFHRVGWVFTLGLSLSSAVDIFITVTLMYLLQRSRTGFSTFTDRLVDCVTLYTVETGMITSIAAAVSLICWLVMPDNLIFLALHFSISKLYANALLATLNARKALRERSSPSNDRNQHSLPVLSTRCFRNAVGAQETGRITPVLDIKQAGEPCHSENASRSVSPLTFDKSHFEMKGLGWDVGQDFAHSKG